MSPFQGIATQMTAQWEVLSRTPSHILKFLQKKSTRFYNWITNFSAFHNYDVELSRQCCYLLHCVKKRKWVKAVFPDNWGRVRWGAIVWLKCNLEGQPVTRSIYTEILKLLSSLLLTWGSTIKGNFHSPKFPLGQQCYNLLAYTNQPLWTLKALLRSLSLFFVLHAL